MHPGAHYPQASLSSIIDIYQSSLFDLAIFESRVCLLTGSLNSLTFLEVFKKLGVDEGSIPKSKVLCGMIDKYRKYCPVCLQEQRAYKLVWQVKEVELCDIHNVKLENECWLCHRKIALLPSKGLNGFCPNCNAELSKAPHHTFFGLSNANARIYQDWAYLLDTSTDGLKPLNNFPMHQCLALRILFAIENSQIKYKLDISSILQYARNSHKYEKSPHINTILMVLRATNMSLVNFFGLQITTDFIEGVIKKKERIVDKLSCLAPWCIGHSASGTLTRTSTSSKVKKNGSKQNYYMVCSKCGIEYCLRYEDKELVERGYFISLAYARVLPLIESELSIKEVANRLKTSEDKIKRSLIFLAANGLTKQKSLPLSIPYRHNSRILKAITKGVKNCNSANQIRRDLGLKYNEFLFYWFTPEVRLISILFESHVDRVATPSEKNSESFKNAVEYHLNHNVPITINNIATWLGVVPETVRFWGMLPKLKEAKVIQREKAKQVYRENLVTKIEEIVMNLKVSEDEITCERVYETLECARTSIWRSYPDLAQYISLLVKYEHGVKSQNPTPQLLACRDNLPIASPNLAR